MSEATPIRTCIGCRERGPRLTLLRVVVIDGHLVPDPTATQPGRGAWLHPTLECLARADRRRAFSRALRVSGALDVDLVRQEIEATTDSSQTKGGDETMSAR